MTTGTDETWVPRPVYDQPSGQRITRPVRYHSNTALGWVTGTVRISTAAGFPTVTTLPSSTLRSRFGVNTHLSWQWTAYANTTANMDAALAYITELGASFYRERFFPTDTEQQAMIPRLAAVGVKHYAIIGNYAVTADDVRADVDALVAAYPDPASVFTVLGGINEPDDPAVDWIPHTVELQQALYAKVRSIPALAAIPVGSPVVRGQSPVSYMTDLAAAGTSAVSDFVTMHHYPVTGEGFETAIDAKLAAAATGYPGKPVSVDEFGYVSADPGMTGNPSPEWVYATYGPRALCEVVRRGVSKLLLYELLDQSDRPVEDWAGHFGLVNTSASLSDPSQWRKKAVFDPMARLIRLTRDDGPDFTPAPLEAAITGTPNTVALAKRGGEHGILHWRNDLVYNGSTKTAITVAPTSQTVRFPIARDVTLTDVTTGVVTSLGAVKSYTVQVAGNVMHASIEPA